MPAPSYRLVGNILNRRLFGPALPSPRYCAQLVSVLMGEGRMAQSWNILGVRNLEAIVWDQDDVLSSLLWTMLASPPMGDLICPPGPRMAEFTPVDGRACWLYPT